MENFQQSARRVHFITGSCVERNPVIEYKRSAPDVCSALPKRCGCYQRPCFSGGFKTAGLRVFLPGRHDILLTSTKQLTLHCNKFYIHQLSTMFRTILVFALCLISASAFAPIASNVVGTLNISERNTRQRFRSSR